MFPYDPIAVSHQALHYCYRNIYFVMINTCTSRFTFIGDISTKRSRRDVTTFVTPPPGYAPIILLCVCIVCVLTSIHTTLQWCNINRFVGNNWCPLVTFLQSSASVHDRCILYYHLSDFTAYDVWAWTGINRPVTVCVKTQKAYTYLLPIAYTHNLIHVTSTYRKASLLCSIKSKRIAAH